MRGLGPDHIWAPGGSERGSGGTTGFLFSHTLLQLVGQVMDGDISFVSVVGKAASYKCQRLNDFMAQWQ